MAIYRYKDVM